MLKAWEAMRHSTAAQIEKLVERCKKFEDEATEKARAIESMRKASRLGSGHKRDGFPSSGRESSRRVALAPAVAAADKENPGSPRRRAETRGVPMGKSPYVEKGSVSPASASLAAFKRKSHVPRADAVPGFRERLDSVVGGDRGDFPQVVVAAAVLLRRRHFLQTRTTVVRRFAGAGHADSRPRRNSVDG